MYKRSKSLVWISAAVFILLEAAAFAMLRSSSAIQDIWINRASHRTMALLWGGTEKLRDFFSLRSINEELATQNAILRNQLEYFRLAEQNDIEDLSAVKNTLGFNYLPATVVKMSRSSAHNYIILNKGYEDGVKPQSGIISDKGVIGIINSVGKSYSYGMTLINTEFRLGVKIGNENVNAILIWDGRRSNGARAINIPTHKEIAVGDTLWTSGYSSIFPPDIPVGIAGVSRLEDGSSLSVEVDLLQDMSSVRYVTITENINRSQIEALEKEALK